MHMPTYLTDIFSRSPLEIALLVFLTSISALLIWARFNVFQTENSASSKGSLFYDPVVCVHLLMTYTCFFCKRLQQAYSY